MKEYSEELKRALNVLRQNGTILYPTDTVWGIGCDATSPDAIAKIFEIKKRDPGKSLILLLDNESKLASYVREIPDQAWTLIEFSEKPLTIIYDGAKNLPPEIIAEDGSIAIRITKDAFCRDLIGAFRKPLISTSANISGEKTAVSFGDIDQNIIDKVDYVVDYRQNEVINAVPSTIIKLTSGGQITFIRK